MRDVSIPAAPLVVKVGGSLLSLPDLKERIFALLEKYTDAPVLFVVGGGTTADMIRDLSATHLISESAAHWLAIRAMSLNAHCLSAILQGTPVADSRDQAAAIWRVGGSAAILDPFTLLSEVRSDELPEGWHVTSDSIAALVAKRFSARRLALLKSVGSWGKRIDSDAAAKGWVDPYFSMASEGLDVFWFNVRSQSMGNS
ncbi:MAG: hypothetical protein U1D30_08610 [Planctomycetota bacterium]